MNRSRMTVTSRMKLVLSVLVGAMLVAAVPSAFAASGQVGGNATCKQLLGDPAAKEVKVDEKDLANGKKFGPVTITGLNGAKTLVGFTSTIPLLGVFVKGGPDGGYFYDYRPAGQSSDSNLGTNGVGNGRYQISHVSFCWLPVVPLTASKTAKASYDKTIGWGLEKSVDPETHSGTAGQKAGDSTWEIVVTKTVTLGNYKVSGVITINNDNTFAVPVTVTDQLNDGTDALVQCPGMTSAELVATATVPAKDSVECDYHATPTGATATVNNATVTPSDAALTPNPQPSALLVWDVNVIGAETARLVDPDVDPPIDEELSESKTYERTESFLCPSTTAVSYVNGKYSYEKVNTATLTPTGGTPIPDSAKVTVHCTSPEVWKGETATGKGPRYPGSSNWFMYTPFAAGPVDLIAGKNYDAGDITMQHVGDTTQITITLHAGFRFADVAANLKIQGWATAPTKYFPPGSFANKFTVSQSQNTITVTVPKNNFFGIHADVERLLP
jgi:hypothetical protein